jgi:purine nucleosidase/pyrimidine-specific ribonucleoside hydrolase
MIALLFFLRNPNFEVRAVTVSVGEAHPEVFAGHVARFLAGLGRADIPVGYGRPDPLEGANAFPDPWREASDRFWDLPLPEAAASTTPVPAAALIVESVAQSDQPVVVFLSGTHTNLAEALRLEPGIAGQISDVHVMGGSIYRPGNIEISWPEIHNQTAEWNIWVDPLAAKEVFASGIPLHVSPLDSTDQIFWTRADARTWDALGTPESDWAADILTQTLDRWSAKGVQVWDLVTAINASDARLCPEVPLRLDVLTAPGPEQGRTVVVDGPANAIVCLEPDAEQIKARAAEILGP